MIKNPLPFLLMSGGLAFAACSSGADLGLSTDQPATSPPDGKAAGGDGGGSSGSDGTGDAGPANTAAPTGPYGLVQKVEESRYFADLTMIAKPRPPGSPHWQEVQDLCASRFTQYGFTVERHDYGTGVNVIGVKPGTAPDAHRVLVGAHYDHVEGCDGADDNGSGTAGVLETARVLSMMSYPKTLVVACWDEEERVMVGSEAYAKRELEAGIRFDGVFVYEMIGYKDEAEGSQKLPLAFGLFFPEASKLNDDNKKRANFIAGLGNPGADPMLAAYQVYAEQVGLFFVPLRLTEGNVSNPLLYNLRRSDHAPFWENGISAMQITDTANFRYDGYHCLDGKADTVDRLDHAFSTQIIQATVGAAAESLGLARDLPPKP